MPLSRERAIDLSHRMVDRLGKTPGVALAAEREFVRNRIVQALLDWDRENARLEKAESRLAARARRPPEGSREWELSLAEEMKRAYEALLGRGE